MQGDPDREAQNPLESLPESDGGADQTVQVFVSLYLILMAFFMVMNSISNQVTSKADAAVESVYTTFRKTYAPNTKEIDLLAKQKLELYSSEFYEQAKGVFADLVDFPGRYASQGGNVLEAELPTAVLFAKNDIHIRADQTRFFNQLADFLRRQNEGEERDIEIRLAVSPAVMDAERPEQELPVLRAAAFARELEDRGVAASSISTGVVSDSRGLVWLAFRARRADVLEHDRKGG